MACSPSGALGMAKETPLIIVPAEHIAERIFIVRGQKVILDAALAALYGVPTKQIGRAHV